MHANRRRRVPWGPIAVVLLAVTLAGVAAIGLNLFGVGDRAETLPAGSSSSSTRRQTGPSTRPSWSPRPTATAIVSVAATPDVSRAPGQTPPPPPTPTPVPVRTAVDVDLLADPGTDLHQRGRQGPVRCRRHADGAGHARQGTADQGVPAGAGGPDRGVGESPRQQERGSRGPSAMVKALEAYGVTGYKVRAYETRQDALVDAARAIETLGAPVILADLARSAHVGHDRLHRECRPARLR